MTDLLAEQWYQLCDEYEEARENYLKVHRHLTGGFSKPEGQRANLDAERRAWEHWHNVRERMIEFIEDKG